MGNNNSTSNGAFGLLALLALLVVGAICYIAGGTPGDTSADMMAFGIIALPFVFPVFCLGLVVVLFFVAVVTRKSK